MSGFGSQSQYRKLNFWMKVLFSIVRGRFSLQNYVENTSLTLLVFEIETFKNRLFLNFGNHGSDFS